MLRRCFNFDFIGLSIVSCSACRGGYWVLDLHILLRPHSDFSNTFAGQGKGDEANPPVVRYAKVDQRSLGPDRSSLTTSFGTRATVLEAPVRQYVSEIFIVDERDTYLNRRQSHLCGHRHLERRDDSDDLFEMSLHFMYARWFRLCWLGVAAS